jgi:hypothetical protein
MPSKAAGTPLVTAAELADALTLPPTSVTNVVAECAAASDGWLRQYLTPGADHSEHPWCRKAALRVAVETWSASKSAGGQPVSNDFAPTPYALGNSLLRMVAGIIAPCRDTSGMVG